MQFFKSLSANELKFSGKAFSGEANLLSALKYGATLIQSAGYSGVELGDDLSWLSNDDVSSLNNSLNDLGLEVTIHLPVKFDYVSDSGCTRKTSFNLFGGVNPESAKASMEYLKTYLSIAEQLNAKYLNTHIEGFYDEFVGEKIGDSYVATDKESSASRDYWNILKLGAAPVFEAHFDKLNNIAGRTKIPIMAENHELSYHLSRPNDLSALNNYQQIGFLLDMGHPFKHLFNVSNGRDWGIRKINDSGTSENYAHSIGLSFEDCKQDGGTGLLNKYFDVKAPNAVHIHQINETGRDHLPLYEKGILDIAKIMAMLKKNNVDYVVVESFYKAKSEKEYLSVIGKNLQIACGTL